MRSEFEVQSRFDFDEKSDADIRIRVLAGEIFNAMTSIEWLKRQMFVATATGEYLDYFASQRGIERKKAQKAQKNIMNFKPPGRQERGEIKEKSEKLKRREKQVETRRKWKKRRITFNFWPKMAKKCSER